MVRLFQIQYNTLVLYMKCFPTATIYMIMPLLKSLKFEAFCHHLEECLLVKVDRDLLCFPAARQGEVSVPRQFFSSSEEFLLLLLGATRVGWVAAVGLLGSPFIYNSWD